MPNNPTLKPCPFCGRKEDEIDRKNIEIRGIKNHVGRISYTVMCRCGINTGEYCLKDAAIRDWNRRSTEKEGT